MRTYTFFREMGHGCARVHAIVRMCTTLICNASMYTFARHTYTQILPRSGRLPKVDGFLASVLRLSCTLAEFPDTPTRGLALGEITTAGHQVMAQRFLFTGPRLFSTKLEVDSARPRTFGRRGILLRRCPASASPRTALE